MNTVEDECEKRIKKQPKYTEQLSACYDNLFDVAVGLEEMKEGNCKDKQAKFDKILTQFCEVDQRLKDQTVCLQEAKSLARGVDISTDDTDWEAILKDTSASLTKKEAHNEELQDLIADNSRKLQKKIWEVHHMGQPMPGDAADEDLEVVQQSLNVHCPITQKLLESPVQNKQCNHFYSEAAIKDLLSQAGRKKFIKCPCAGCPGEVREGSFERSRTMERAVQKHVREADRAKEAVPDDDQRDNKRAKTEPGDGAEDLTQKD